MLGPPYRVRQRAEHKGDGVRAGPEAEDLQRRNPGCVIAAAPDPNLFLDCWLVFPGRVSGALRRIFRWPSLQKFRYSIAAFPRGSRQPRQWRTPVLSCRTPEVLRLEVASSCGEQGTQPKALLDR